MKKEKILDHQNIGLRKRAEAVTKRDAAGSLKYPGNMDSKKSVHELRVHKIELEMQNEELSRIRDELEESRDRYAEIFDFAPIGNCVIDVKGVITEINHFASRMLGHPRSMLIQRRFAVFVEEKYRGLYAEFIKHLFSSEEHMVVELKLLSKGGTSFFARVDGIRTQGGDSWCLIAISDISTTKNAEELLSRDKEHLELLVAEKTKELNEKNDLIKTILRKDNISLRKKVDQRTLELIQAQEALDRSRRMADIGRFSATIAHEMRNPLSAIKAAAYNIKKKANNSTLDKNIDTINKKVSESDSIIDNLLSFTRIRQTNFEKHNIRAMLEDAISTIKNKRPNMDVAVISDFKTPPNAVIKADITQMQMLFTNLIDNAFQSLPKQTGTVKVSLRLNTNSEYEVQVVDTGSGIDDKDRAKIFEPFFTTKVSGSGIGLTLCKEIVEVHRGKIEVKTTKGKGSVFTVTLPRNTAPRD